MTTGLAGCQVLKPGARGSVGHRLLKPLPPQVAKSSKRWWVVSLARPHKRNQRMAREAD
jgi:hypothetical protein